MAKTGGLSVAAGNHTSTGKKPQKNRNSAWFCLFLIVSLIFASACVAERGRLGPAGTNGTPGSPGPAGAGNMTMNLTANMTAGPQGIPGLDNMTAGPIGPTGPTGPMGPENLTAINNSYYLRDNSLPLTSEKVRRDVDNDLLTIYGSNAIAGGTGGILSLFGVNTVNPNSVEIAVGDGAVGNTLVTSWKGGATPMMDMNGYNITGIRTITDGYGGATKLGIETLLNTTNIEIRPNETALMVFNASLQRIGINTEFPARETHIKGKTTSTYMRVESSSGTYMEIGDEPAGGYVQTSSGRAVRLAPGGGTRLILQTNGNLSLGNYASTAQFDTTGTVRFRNFGAGTMMTDASGNIYIISDPQYKTGIKPYTVGLKELLSLPSSAIITYKFKPESGLDTVNEYSGVDAAQLRTAIPEAVYEKGKVTYEQVLKTPAVRDEKTGITTEAEYEQIEKPVLDKDGKQVTELSVSNMPIIMAEVNAIKELNAKIEAQNETINKQEARIAALEKKVGIVKP